MGLTPEVAFKVILKSHIHCGDKKNVTDNIAKIAVPKPTRDVTITVPSLNSVINTLRDDHHVEGGLL